jgi:hypothetical protein
VNNSINNNTIYAHFSAYGLAESGKVAQRLQQLSESELAQFFAIYIALAKKRHLAYRAHTGNTDIYPDSWDSTVSLETVKQLAIYANRIYVHDPLLELAHGWQSLDLNIPLRMQNSSQKETQAQYLFDVARAIEEMVALRPLAEAQVVYFTPTFLIQEHRDPRDIYSDTFYGSTGSAEKLLGREKSFELPLSFAKYVRDHFHIVPARQEAGKAILLPDQPLGPRRTIALSFDGDPSPIIQLLANIQPSQREELHLRLQYSFDEEPPEELTFWNWIEGTRRQVIRERLERLEQDIVVAATAHATFLTSLPTSQDLVQLSTAGEEGRDTDVLTALLRMELPYFDQASFDSIAKARRDEIAFEDFRSALNKAFREINNLTSCCLT